MLCQSYPGFEGRILENKSVVSPIDIACFITSAALSDPMLITVIFLCAYL